MRPVADTASGVQYERQEFGMPLNDWFSKCSEAEPAPVKVGFVNIGGSPELNFLLISISPTDVLRGLDGWRWIGLEGLTAIAVSAFGDVFFRDAYGAILHLDPLEGRLAKAADDLESFAARLQEAEGRDELLLGGLVVGARRRGQLLCEGECYDFRISPVLGGEISADAMINMPFVAKMHVAGQLHQLPPGTRIGRITISD